MASDRTECGIDPGAYVLGELSGAEREAFRRHMLGCAACREQVDELQSATGLSARLAALAEPAAAAPPTLKEAVRGQARARVMQARARSAQARLQAARDDSRAHAVEPDAHVQSGDSEPHTAGLQARIGDPDQLLTGSPRRARRARQPIAKRPSTGVAALLAAVALTVGLSFASPTSDTYPAAVSWRPGGAILKVSGGKGELFVTGMPAPGPGEIYEVWLQHETRPPFPTTARFEVDAAGQADVVVPGDLSAVSRVLVSAEPGGGSRKLTRRPVLIATLNTAN